ncbi:glucuronate isomerase [Salinifilum ghardaiensis]
MFQRDDESTNTAANEPTGTPPEGAERAASARRGGAKPLRPHPDRLLPSDTAQRAIARRLYEHVRDAPIISPHGHVDPELLATDRPFGDAASLLVTPDHYVTRLLHSRGAELSQLGLPDRSAETEPAPPRQVWRRFCSEWYAFAGTATRQWLECELHDVLGVRAHPSPETADALFDEIGAALARPEMRPRALFDRFRIEVLATTDDPADDLRHHRALAEDPTWSGRVVPTFRPDRHLDATAPGWLEALDELGAAAGFEIGDYRSLIRALEDRRERFRAHGATATDHGAPDARMEFLDAGQAQRLFAAARDGTAGEAERRALSRQLLGEMARMSSEDGMVMTLHTGSFRGHHTETRRRFGPDTGHDIPLRAEYTESLRSVLDRFGTHPNFRTVVCTLDEAVFSRELAPLAGFYPSVYLGAPWWFLDAPRAMRRFRDAVTETAGFTRTAGFIDDTRAFCSIPARHDTARRVDAAHLAGLVAEHVLDEDEAAAVLRDQVHRQPREAFRL